MFLVITFVVSKSNDMATSNKKKLDSILKELELYAGKLEDISSELQSIKDDMESTFDERSERWQESDNGQDYLTKMESLDRIISYVDDAVSAAQSAVDDMNNL